MPSEVPPSFEESFQRALFEHAVDGCFVIDVSRNQLLAVNDAFCSLLECSREELVPKLASGLFLPLPRDLAAMVSQISTDDCATAEPIWFDLRIERKSGEAGWADVRARIVTIEGRDVLVGISREITAIRNEHRRLKEALRHESNVLEESQLQARQAAQTIDARTHMVQVLAAMPQLNQLLSEAVNVKELARRACLFVSNRNEGMRFDSCAIYVLQEGAMEVLYANPFLVRERYELSELGAPYADALENLNACFETPEGGRIVAIRVGGRAFGILEVGVPRSLDAMLSADADTQQTFKNGIISLAGMIGLQLTQMQLLEAIQRQVVEDELTGLFNRRRFTEVLQTEFKRSIRYDRNVSLLVLDIDHFKRVNDTYGHAQGDVVLRRVADLLKRHFRDVDSVCRIGGEEIAILLPETPKASAAAKANIIRGLIAQEAFPLSRSLVDQGKSISITVSIGVAAMSDKPASAEELFQLADRALFAAKNSGRNRVGLA